MCGIAGIVSRHGDHTAAEQIRLITRKLDHRGPDDEGYVSLLDGRVHLGHRRLSIVDLSSGGHQPMSDPSGRYWITYNGEVYNHPELRSELMGLGHDFRSCSDTEVILAAYAEWGVSCLQRFNGMWAFAIVDTERRELFLARDRFGVKPLHYYLDSDRLVFASEIKALVAHQSVRTGPNLDWCRSYLSIGSQEHTRETAFRGIARFAHSCFALVPLDDVFDRGIVERQYWSLGAIADGGPQAMASAESLAREYRALLESAVALRLRSDVKVGSALSGGLDSTSIVHLVNGLLRGKGGTVPAQQETFSVVYRDYATKDCDESFYIDMAVRELGVRSHRIQPRTEEIPEQCLLNIYAMDNPPESSCMSAWHTFKLVASTDVVVTIDGQGADEQLAGYLHYLLGFVVSAQHYPWGDVARFARVPGAAKYLIAGTGLRLLAGAFGERRVRGWLARRRPLLERAFVPLNQWLVSDTLTALVTLLHFADRTSMAFSVESRMPFMDYRLAEFLAKMPPEYKLSRGWTKYVARLAFDGALPDEITWRRDKKGWPIPEDHWFRGVHREWFCSTIERSAFLRELGVGADIRSQMDAGRPIGRLIRLLNLALWHDIYFGDRERFLRMRLPGRQSRQKHEQEALT